MTNRHLQDFQIKTEEGRGTDVLVLLHLFAQVERTDIQRSVLITAWTILRANVVLFYILNYMIPPHATDKSHPMFDCV